MRVLVVGSGAREHALAWKIARSREVDALYCAPGNAGTAEVAENVPIAASEVEALADWAAERRIDLTVVGPEDPLVRGLVDRLHAKGLLAFGPTAAGARIEGSKVFSKALMEQQGVPTARGAVFESADEARRYLRTQPLPIVVVADGLAAGKGVTIARTLQEAEEAVADRLERGVFGEAGRRVLIEECLVGPEVSVLALVDGRRAIPLIPACDYKRVFDGDEGPNTGGMGSYAPPGFVTPEVYHEIAERVLDPVIRGLRDLGIDYRGVLYAGLMLTADGPRCLEFNARFGDPETQVVLPLLESDLVEVMRQTAAGYLDPSAVRWREGACCGVVLASGGYPGRYSTGEEIVGLDELDPDVAAFHAGTRREGERLVTAGGRVLTVAATGRTMAEARERAYANVERIHFAGMHFRRDIALREIR